MVPHKPKTGASVNRGGAGRREQGVIVVVKA